MTEHSIESLRRLAREAITRWKDDGLNLNQAVISVTRGRDLTDEQVKRVTEETNVAAYLDEFDRAGDRRNVVFEGGPADPQVVLTELRDNVVRLPKRSEMSRKQTVADTKLAEIETTTRPQDGYNLLMKQASMLSSRAQDAELKYEDCRFQLVGAVKLAQAAGSTPEDIWAAVKQAAKTEWGANLALQEIESQFDLPQGGVKTAGRLVADHPLVLVVRELEKTAYDYRVSREAVRSVEGELDEFARSLVSFGS